MSTPEHVAEVAVVGAGIVGIATAWALSTRHAITNIAVIGAGEPMAFTSAQSAENYRNWWPRSAMTALADRSTDLMEKLSCETDDRIGLTRRGYLLATREDDIEPVVAPFHATGDEVRVHVAGSASTYRPATSPDWRRAPDGVDVVTGRALIHDTFPYLDPAVRAVVHVRRAGDVASQQLGTHMLEACRARGARRWRGEVTGIERRDRYEVGLRGPGGPVRIASDMVVNAAGPFAGDIARMLDVSLPLLNTFQQKIAFEDRERCVRRDMPFAIDLDPQRLDWSDEERELPLFEHFPDVVLRAATRLLPRLERYQGRLPHARHHYGGLIHEDRRELASDRADGTAGRVHELRALRLWHHDGLRSRRTVRELGRRCGTARIRPRVLVGAS